MAGLSNAVELSLLEHLVAKTSYTMPTSPLYLALVQTNAVVETDTAATITEATYTGYARKSVAGTDWGAAAAGQIANANAITFAACTAGTNTIIGWALVTTSSGAGTIQCYGTLPSLVVSSTQTPVNFAVGALVVTAD
jgi:hypothetical protein